MKIFFGFERILLVYYTICLSQPATFFFFFFCYFT